MSFNIIMKQMYEHDEYESRGNEKRAYGIWNAAQPRNRKHMKHQSVISTMKLKIVKLPAQELKISSQARLP